MPNLPLKPPPRPNVSTAGFVGAPNGVDGGERMESNQPMPHVVRVKFLGVAGILAKPCKESLESSKTSASISEGFIQASPDHPSLLIPVPTNLRVVATVSRTRTAKGIPSGMSKCLISSRPPSLVDNPNSSPKSTNATNEITETITTTLMHDKVATQITIHTKQDHSFSEDGSIFTEPKTVEGEHQSVSLSVVTEYSSLPKQPPVPSTPCPPSQLMQGRTGSDAASGFGGKRISSSIASRSAPVESNEVHEFVEVVGPSRSEGCSNGKSAGETMETAPSEETDNDKFCFPQRYVAIWDDKSDHKGTRDLRGAADENKNKGLVGENSRRVNNTNVLAFEAELRPASTAVNTTAPKTPPTPFAPKMFCVTVGLIPDDDKKSVASSLEKSDENSTDGVPKSKTPYFAIPVGLAHLVIRGTETLDGKRLQVDLPLASLNQFMGSFGGETNAAKEFPVMELSSESISSKEEKSKNCDQSKDGKNINQNESKNDKNKIKMKDDKSKEQDGKQHKPKSKKKGIMSRMFSRSKQSAPSTALGKQQEEEEKMLIYNGDPRSIFDLGRPPNSLERALFSERYGIDPSGDAVIRIGLEVFPRGSELEKTFRQKHRLRREQRKKALAATNKLESHAEPVRKSQSFGSLSRSSSKGSESYSLVDDEDETLLDSDSDYSESFVSLDSNTSGSIWDESTLETDATDTYYSLQSRSESFMTNSVITDAETSFTETVATPKTGRSSKSSNVFGRVLDCKLETSDSPDRANQSNEVTRGLANFTNLFFACNGLEVDNNSEMTTLLKPTENAGVMPFGKDFHKKQSADDQSFHKKYVARGRDGEFQRSSTGASNEIGIDDSLEISQSVLLEGEEEESHHDDSTIGVSNENLEGHEMTLEQLSQG